MKIGMDDLAGAAEFFELAADDHCATDGEVFLLVSGMGIKEDEVNKARFIKAANTVGLAAARGGRVMIDDQGELDICPDWCRHDALGFDAFNDVDGFMKEDIENLDAARELLVELHAFRSDPGEGGDGTKEGIENKGAHGAL